MVMWARTGVEARRPGWTRLGVDRVSQSSIIQRSRSLTMKDDSRARGAAWRDKAIMSDEVGDQEGVDQAHM